MVADEGGYGTCRVNWKTRLHDESLPLRGCTVIDLCAGGLGGFGLGLTSLGADLLLACEKDDEARSTYMHNVRPRKVHADLCTLDGTKLTCDILTLGLLCQAFSTAGKRKGFADPVLAEVYRHTKRLLREIMDFMQRFVDVGLVANIGRRANGGLRFDMPLAPIQSKQAVPSGEVTPPPSGKMPVISPDQVEAEIPESPAQARVCSDPTPSLSVMINKDLNISNDGADSAVAETAPCRVADAAPVRENPVAPPPAAGPRLSPLEIQQTIQDDWTYSETGTSQSLALFQSWADAGITREDLHAAMNSLDQASHLRQRVKRPTARAKCSNATLLLGAPWRRQRFTRSLQSGVGSMTTSPSSGLEESRKRHCTLLIQHDAAALIDMRRRERCWLSRINSSLLGWHLAPPQLLKLEGWYEAGKIHEALSRDMVRSKSEVIIANMLHERDVTFLYEKPLFAPDGTMYLPDFTLVWQGEEIYWEHVGRLSDPEYAQKWAAKLIWYEKHFPGKLRVTYEKNPGLAPGAPTAPLDVSLQADQIIKGL